MKLTLDQLAEEAMQLPNDQKTALIEKLMESMEPYDADEILNLWCIEAKRRLAEIESGQVQTIPAEEVYDEVRRTLRR